MKGQCKYETLLGVVIERERSKGHKKEREKKGKTERGEAERE